MYKKNLKNLFTLLVLSFFLLPLSVQAAPNISGTSGAFMTDNQAFTISGLDFGSKSPAAPILWETFDDGVNDSNLASPWSAHTGEPLKYSSTTPYGGSGLSVMNRVAYGDGHASKFSSAYFRFPATDKLYYSYMSRHVGPTISKKVYKNGRINTGSDPYSGDGMIAISDEYVFYRPGSLSVYPEGRRFDTVSVGSSNWQRHQIYGKVSSPAGAANGHIFAQVHTQRNDYPNIVSRLSGYDFKYSSILLGTMLDKPAVGDVHYFYIDDVYVDNTQARVELCSGSTWANRQSCNPQIPSNWSNTAITFTVNQGSFSSGQTAYLYVLNADGSTSAAGYPISIGATVEDTSPPVVTNTSPINNSTGVVKDSSNLILFNENLNCALVNTGSVNMVPANIASVTCSGSVITVTPSDQADATQYTLTIGTAITDFSGNYLAAPYVFSYTTANPTATCATDSAMCGTFESCSASWPAYNFCPSETPSCKSTSCADACSEERWYLCLDSSSCLAAGQHWWENACRTKPEPSLWFGENLITNPKLDSWSNGLPFGWKSYLSSKIEQNPLGARIFDQGHVYQTMIEPNTTYSFAYNLPVVNGSSEVWYYDVSIFNTENGTITGSFTTPEEPISDHSIYFKTPAGSDNIINDIVLKKATLASCSTDPALCETELSCTEADWSYCDGLCQRESCSVNMRFDVDGSLSINTTDALLTLRKSLGLNMTATSWHDAVATGDANCDGATNSTDALLILRYSLGLSMSETEWCEYIE